MKHSIFGSLLISVIILISLCIQCTVMLGVSENRIPVQEQEKGDVYVMTSNQIAYWGNKIKEAEAGTKAKEAETNARKLALDEKLRTSEHMHEYGSISTEKNKDIGLKQWKDTTQGVKNFFGSVGDILGPIAKAMAA